MFHVVGWNGNLAAHITRVARSRRPRHSGAGFFLRSTTETTSLGRRRLACDRQQPRIYLQYIALDTPGIFFRPFRVSAYNSLTEAGLLPSFSLNGTESLQQVPHNRLRPKKMIEASTLQRDGIRTRARLRAARQMWKKCGAHMPQIFTARQQG